MPGDWSDEQRRILHYQELGKPLDAQAFVRSLKKRLSTALAQFNRVLTTNNPRTSCRSNTKGRKRGTPTSSVVRNLLTG